MKYSKNKWDRTGKDETETGSGRDYDRIYSCVLIYDVLFCPVPVPSQIPYNLVLFTKIWIELLLHHSILNYTGLGLYFWYY